MASLTQTGADPWGQRLSLSKKPRRVPLNGRNQVKSIFGADRIRAKNTAIRASVRPQGVRAARMQIR